LLLRGCHTDRKLSTPVDWYLYSWYRGSYSLVSVASPLVSDSETQKLVRNVLHEESHANATDCPAMSLMKQLYVAAGCLILILNKAFIDIGLHPSITTPAIRPRPNVTSSVKPEVHNVSQCRQRRTEPRPQRICTKSFVKIGPAVPEICSQTKTDRYTHTQTNKLVAILRSRTGAELQQYNRI